MYKKYDKILNKGFQLSNFLNTGFSVEEKLDGSNASFTYDADAKKMRAFSRNQELTEENHLNGFYQHVQFLSEHLTEDQLDILSEYTIFGEWLVKHAVTYKDELYNNFYAFDVFDKVNRYYIDRDNRLNIFSLLKLKTTQEFVVLNSKVLATLDISEQQILLEEIK